VLVQVYHHEKTKSKLLREPVMQTTKNKIDRLLPVERAFIPHHEAMLAALRLILGLPQIPVTLEEETK